MFVIISQLEKTLCWISLIEILLDSTHITSVEGVWTLEYTDTALEADKALSAEI